MRRSSLVLKRMGYHLKVMWGGYWIGAIAVLAISAVLAGHAGAFGLAMPERGAQTAVIAISMTVFASLVFSAVAAEELEERVMRLLYACPFPALYIFLEKFAMCLLLLLAGISLCASAAVMPLPSAADSQEAGIWDAWWPLARAAVPSSLFVGAVSAAASLIGRNVLAGLGAGIGYLILELFMRGKWTGPFYLFQSVWPNERTDNDINALLLCSAAAFLFCLAAVLFAKGKQWLANM